MVLSDRFPPGTVIGNDFEIVRPLSQGGMGTVYVAIQRATGAPRALKLMRRALLGDAKFRQRFEQEARVGSRIRSDHVVQVVAAGVDERTQVPWLAMELLEGKGLAEYLEERRAIAPGEARLILGQICHALAAAHEVGVVHRDLKADNVFLAASRMVGMPFVVKLLDFGVAKILSEANRSTLSIGTPMYMAPEQSQPTVQIGPSADVWALGLLTFRILTGHHFWLAGDDENAGPAAVWREVLVEPIPSATERARRFGAEALLPPGFDAWFEQCVQRDIGARFANARLAEVDLAPMLRAMHELSASNSRPPEAHEGDMDSLRFGDSSRGVEHSITPLGDVAAALNQASPTGRTGNSVRVTYREKSEKTIVEATRGSTLLEISRANNIPHAQACGGKAQCTTCRVLIVDGIANVTPRNQEEAAVASLRQWQDSIRLACQARALGDVTLRRLMVDTEDQSLLDALPPEVLPSKRAAVVLRCALRSFSAFVRDNLPYDVVHVLNRCLRQLREPILANAGSLDHYAGAGLVAVFEREPADPSQSASDAVRASLRMIARLKQLNQYLNKYFGSELDLSVGLHYGTLLSGQVGHPAAVRHLSFGEALDRVEQIQRLAEHERVHVLASPAFMRLVGGEVRAGRSVQLVTEAAGAPAELSEILDFKKPDAIFIVQSTFERLVDRADDFARAFYEQLFEIAPQVEPLFEDIDMATQRHMLMSMLTTTIRGIDRMDGVISALQELGRRHVAVGVQTVHYKYVGQALLWAIERFLGPEFTPEVQLAWMEIYATLAKTMIDATRSP